MTEPPIHDGKMVVAPVQHFRTPCEEGCECDGATVYMYKDGPVEVILDDLRIIDLQYVDHIQCIYLKGLVKKMLTIEQVCALSEFFDMYKGR